MLIMYEHRRGESGEMAELEYLGSLDKGKFRQELTKKYEILLNNEDKAGTEEFIKNIEQGLPPYIDYPKSLQMVKLCQPDKYPEYAEALKEKVSKLLKSQELINKEPSYFTTCVQLQVKSNKIKSPFDQWHHVDAFFEVELTKGEKVTITIDGSLNPDKKGTANIITIFPENLDSHDNMASFDEFVLAEAQKIVDFVKQEAR